MKILRALILLLTIVNLAMLLSINAQRRRLQELLREAEELSTRQSECGTIHKPKSGCPAGFREVPDVFKRDGKRSPACVDPKRPQCVDIIYPGESYTMTLRVAVP